MWMTMIESFEYILYEGIDSQEVEKLNVIMSFFKNNLLAEDKEVLISHLRRSNIDERFFESPDLPIDSISRMLYAIRNEFAHGLEFHTSIFSESNDNNYLESIRMREFRKDAKEERHFEISITYEQLRKVIIKTSINLIENRLNEITG